jgi:hypothetical protein
MPKVDRQGAKVRSAAAFVRFCAVNSSDAQQKSSSNRRIAGSQSPKRRNRLHCQQAISALGHSQAKRVRENFLPGEFHPWIKISLFCLLQTFMSRKRNLTTAINSLIIY